jgi:hypothetical protein
MAGASAMLARTGAKSMTLRYSEPDEDEDGPVVWIAIAEYEMPDGESIDQVAGALDPLSALHRLLDHLIDGGTCGNCGRSTAFLSDPDMGLPRSIEGREVCWVTWDASSEAYVKDCQKPRPNGGDGG